MLGDLPKLFDRDFAIGYFLPVACFLGSLYALLTIFQHKDIVAPVVQSNVLIGTTTLALITWLIGVILLVLNRQLHQIFSVSPLFPGHKWPRWTRQIEKRRFRRVWEDFEGVQAKEKLGEEAGKDTGDLRRRRAELHRMLVERFPQDEPLLSPTTFGNVINAFQQYPKVMYGIDAIDGWARLLAVIPKEYKASVEGAKAQTDFWLNLCFFSGAIFVIYWVLVAHGHHFRAGWFPLVNIAVMCIAYMEAVTAAKEWGVFFKASFDIFLPELYTKLRFSQPSDADAEWDTWDTFSKAIIFQSRISLPPRSQLGESKTEEPAEEQRESENEAGEEDKDTEGEEDEKDETTEDATDGDAETAISDEDSS